MNLPRGVDGSAAAPTTSALRRRVDDVLVHRRALAALIAAACVIALSPLCIRSAHPHGLGPVTIAFWRLVLSLPALALWRSWSRRGQVARVDDGRAAGLTLAVGVLFAIDLALWHAAVLTTSIADATVLSNLAPVFVVLLALVLFGRRPRPLFVLGMFLAIAGAAMLASARPAAGSRHLAGDGLALGAAAAYAGYLVALERLRQLRDTPSLMLGASAVCAAVLLPLATIVEGPPRLPPIGAWPSLLVLALAVHVVGQGLITTAVARLPAALASIGLLTQAVVAAALAWAVLGEAIGLAQFAGGIAILAGIVVARASS